MAAEHAGHDEAALGAAVGGGGQSYDEFLDLLPGAKPTVPPLVPRAEFTGGPKAGGKPAPFRPGFLLSGGGGGGGGKQKKKKTKAADGGGGGGIAAEFLEEGEGSGGIRSAADDYLEQKRAAAAKAAAGAFAAADAELEELGFEEIDEEGEVSDGGGGGAAGYCGLQVPSALLLRLRPPSESPPRALPPASACFTTPPPHPPPHAAAPQVTVGGRMNAPTSPGRLHVDNFLPLDDVSLRAASHSGHSIGMQSVPCETDELSWQREADHPSFVLRIFCPPPPPRPARSALRDQVVSPVSAR